MNKFIIISYILIFTFSCKEKRNYPINKGFKEYTIINDSAFSFNKNGTIEEKGVFINGLREGWWYHFNSTKKLITKKEFIILRDSTYENQSIYYDKEGKIIDELSSYFTLELPDTIPLGKSLGYLNYYSNTDADLKYLNVIIENKYSESEIKKDTFNDGNYRRTGFGINAYKKGVYIIKGTLIDNYLVTREPDKVKGEYSIKGYIHKKYFKKEVYVKDTHCSR